MRLRTVTGYAQLLLIIALGHKVAGHRVPVGPYTPSWESVSQHPTPTWFQDAKFGIYAHWGPYSVPAYSSEWYSHNMYVNGSTVNKYHVARYGEQFGYKDFIPLFTADKFNASEWAEVRISLSFFFFQSEMIG